MIMILKKTILKTIVNIANIFYPKICIICRELSNYKICLNCYRQCIKLETLEYCHRCGVINKSISNNLCFHCIVLKAPAYDSINSVFVYTLSIKKLIHIFKFKNSQHLARIISIHINSKYCHIINKHDVIIPVPITYIGLIKRGYDHTLEITKLLSKFNKISYKCLIKKCKNTSKQHNLTYSARQDNIFQAFSINKKYKDDIKNKNIIIFDDVITTGATINECCRILKEFEPKKITVITYARTIKQ